jgi:hypothetical protein
VSNQPPPDLDPRVITLHRYYLWSTVMHGQFEDVLTGIRERGQRFSIKTDEGILGLAYMSYWYASLWVVVEGWQKLGLHDDEVDRLLDSALTEKLKLFRHGVLHFHENYFNQPLVDPFIRDEESVAWVRSLSQALGRSFLERFGALKERRAVQPDPPG